MAIEAELRLARDLQIQAEESFKIRVHLATEQGLTTQQIADGLGCSQAAASKWRIQGEQLLGNRERAEDTATG
jgi:transposase-like protein